MIRNRRLGDAGDMSAVAAPLVAPLTVTPYGPPALVTYGAGCTYGLNASTGLCNTAPQTPPPAQPVGPQLIPATSTPATTPTDLLSTLGTVPWWAWAAGIGGVFLLVRK
jgi:hypothetical protein